MNKTEFLTELEIALSGLPSEDIQKSLDFYTEMIEDRIEDGLSEQDAVSQVGLPQEIAKQILMDTPITRLVKQKIKPKRRLGAWEIVLLLLGSPLWLSLLIAMLSVVLAVYVSLWSVVVSLWASGAAFGGCVIGGIASAVIIFTSGQNAFAGIVMIAIAMLFVGICILFFFVCRAATKGMVWLTKRITLFVKSCFLRKERV